MAFEIIWTRQAEKDYDKIINYIAENWGDKEIRDFIGETERFFEILSHHPEILQRSANHESVYRGPINRLTILIYRVKPLKKQIVLIRVRGARQKPLKRYPPL